MTEISPPAAQVAARWEQTPEIEREIPSSVDGSRGVVKRRWSDDSRWMSCLVSTIVHTALLLALALWTFARADGARKPMRFTLGPASESIPMSVSIRAESTPKRAFDIPDEPVDALTPSDESPLVDLAKLRFGPLNRVEDNESGSLDLVPPELAALASPSDSASSRASLTRLPSSSSLEGRLGSARERVGRDHGATEESERAVEAALAWLADHQRGSGAWSFDLSTQPCDGRCRDSKRQDDSTPTPSTAATGLALLAFLGAGYTHEQGKYAEVVQKGLYYLRGAGLETETGIDWQQGSMYGHGIALMAVAEAAAMSGKDGQFDRELIQLAKEATNFTCAAQHSNGSWGYVPGSPGDTTLTGWQVLSLVAARRNQIGLPTPTMPRAKSFVISMADANKPYAFGYQGPPAKPTTTAIGLTLLLYLGDPPGFTPFESALTQMARRGPTRTNVYHDYYATLALHHAGHRDFGDYFAIVRQHLIVTQSQAVHEGGSWHFKDDWGDIGGRLYTTAMAAMILEVPYRYLPLYGPADHFPL